MYLLQMPLSMYSYVNLLLYFVKFCCKLLFEKWNAEITQTETENYSNMHNVFRDDGCKIYCDTSILSFVKLSYEEFHR